MKLTIKRQLQSDKRKRYQYVFGNLIKGIDGYEVYLNIDENECDLALDEAIKLRDWLCNLNLERIDNAKPKRFETK